MLKKLRFKLVAINMSIIFMLFLVLIVGVYTFLRQDMTRKAEFMTQNVANDIATGQELPKPMRYLTGEPMPPQHFERRPEFAPGDPGPPRDVFFAIVDDQGAIAKTSAFLPVTAEGIQALAAQVRWQYSNNGDVVVEHKKYYYYKLPMEKGPGTVYVFRDVAQEESMLSMLLAALVTIGIVCLVLSFWGSMFMADRAMVPIKEAWQQQKDFLADASHELRTPLAVIQTSLDIVRQEGESTVASQKLWIDNISEAATDMTKLVNDLLFLARADSQQQLLENKEFMLNAALQRTTQFFQVLAAEKQVALRWAGVDEYPYRGDENKIREMTRIIIDNAIRHTPSGGQVTVALQAQPNKALIEVTDTGEGIEAKYIDKIFDRFFQVDCARAKGGAGLGLSIAKWIAENHGGHITVTSAKGQGSTFTIHLPHQC